MKISKARHQQQKSMAMRNGISIMAWHQRGGSSKANKDRGMQRSAQHQQ